MENLSGLGKFLMLIGGLLFLIGLIILLSGKIPSIGKMPGDFAWKGKNWFVYFPLGTSILLSILLTLIIWLIRKFNS